MHEKGISELAAAAEALAGASAHRSVRFVWVGPPDPDKPDHVERAAAEALTLVDARDDMPAVCSALDVFALPSWREGFSRSAMEAAACGVAMAVSDVRGCREISEDGVHLRLVPPGDAEAWTRVLGELVDDAEQRRVLGAASSTARVPSALACHEPTGSSIERGTDGTAAKCATASQPSMAAVSASGSSTLAARKSTSTPVKVVAAPGRQVVEADHVEPAVGGQPTAEVSADEPGGPSDEYAHGAGV